MASNTPRPTDEPSAEVARVIEQLTARLASRSVKTHLNDSSDDLGSLLEAVEAFESAVESKGGDLMVDEAPSGQEAQPDNASFVLPERHTNEAASAYIERIAAATESVKK